MMGRPVDGTAFQRGAESLETGYGDLAVLNWCGDRGQDPPSEVGRGLIPNPHPDSHVERWLQTGAGRCSSFS